MEDRLLNDRVLRREIILAQLKNPELGKFGSGDTEYIMTQRFLDLADVIIDELNENGL